MKKRDSAFCSLALLAANSCAMAGLFTVVSIVERSDRSDPGLALWLMCLVLCHLGLRLFLRKERSERALIFFCGAFFLLQAVLVFGIHGFFPGLMGNLIVLCMWLYSYYSCYELALKPPTAEKITKSFDLCCVVLIFALFFCSVKAQPLKLLLPMAVSDVLCLFGLVVVRGGEQRNLRSLFLSGSALLVFGLVSVLFVALASGGVKRILELVSAAVSALLGFVLRCIDALFRFLASLFPQKEYEQLAHLPTEPVSFGAPQDMSFQYIDGELVMSVIIGLGLLVALLAVIYRIVKGKHFKVSYTGGTERGIRRSRSGILSALKRSFHKLFAALSFRIRAARARNTASGLFWQIERRSRTKLRGRAESESCREFLVRASGIYPHALTELMRLADAMDACCFGAGQELSAAEIIKMRRIIFSGKHE